MDILLLLLGLGLILAGANFLTDGSAALAQRFRVSEFVIGLTIVAIGTSTPELVVSVLSAIGGQSDVAIGNVVGSNIFNVFVILGLCALVRPLPLSRGNVRRDIPVGLGASLRNKSPFWKRFASYLTANYIIVVVNVMFGLFTLGSALLVTIPLIRGFKQRNYVETEGHDIRKAFAEIFHTLKNIATHDKKVLFFLIAFFLYIDGVGTIIDNAINIGTDLNLNTVGQVVFLLATQVVAFGGSLVFAKLSKKYNTVTLILVCIAGYFGIALYALMLSSLLHFAILAFFIGCFQGSIQSLSRSYYSKIIPAENSGEYFGIYDIFSKGASFLGSAVIAAVKLAGGTINVAVACLAVFFALGFLFLRIADKQKAIR